MKDSQNPAWDSAEADEQRYSSAPIPANDDNYSLRDRLDILNLLSLYGHLFDSGFRTVWLETVFAPHVVWTLAPQPAVGRDTISAMRGREEVKSWFSETPRAYRIYVEKQFFDVHYSELNSDPVAVARDIHRHFGMPFYDATEQAMQGFMAEHQHGKHGTHKYSLEEFGLDKAIIDEEFDEYLQAYNIPNSANAR